MGVVKIIVRVHDGQSFDLFDPAREALMARGVAVTAETQDEAEDQILDGHPEMRVLSSREINLDGIPGKPWPKHWVVVVEHLDPEREAELPQHDDPEEEAERSIRQDYLAIALDPELLVVGSIEQFSCPGCGEEIQIELPAPRERKDPGHADCPKCESICADPRALLAGRCFVHRPRLRPSASFAMPKPTVEST